MTSRRNRYGWITPLKLLLPAIAGVYLFSAPGISACELNTESCTLDPTRVGWNAISLEARKFIFSGSTRVQIDLVDSMNLSLIAVDQGVPVAAGAQALELRAESRGLGTHSDAVLWIDPFSGAALQYKVEDSGRRQRQRIYRYTNEGAFHRTRHPAKGEADRPPEDWTDLDSGLTPYAPEAVDQVVIDPISLLYIISASHLNKPGDTLQMTAFARRQNTRLTLTVEQRAGIEKVLSDRLSNIDMPGCRRPSEALLVRLSSEPLTSQEDPKFSFLGLRSDISIWLDPVTRLPIQITGRAKIIGRVTVNLFAARCR